MGPPSIYKKTFQQICANLRRGLNISGGPNPPIPRGDTTGKEWESSVIRVTWMQMMERIQQHTTQFQISILYIYILMSSFSKILKI